ncbi:carbonic anhydrase [Spirochaeta africana]|uniref:Carbonic anhydrase n=1 Tax=Spirochaeta africana (strain ATCC 700263 / DSM 8902 / Z-7692) TaxID=889378 RepID=H9UKS3_SPIAZ|nr:carbonic anhydrase [Spirochaeta africana]AFG38116.1 carbonic anhydrase [Spirochaeta africana DSM 8902]
MPDLIQRAAWFRSKGFAGYGSLFAELGLRQNPHTLFIACSDSRVDPNLITGSVPGELFVIRNIANIVPDYDRAAEDVAVSSAVEYAVKVLEVENIVVCGHSNCGGCKAMCSHSIDTLELTSSWLEFAGELKEVIRDVQDSDSGCVDYTTDVLQRVELENVVLQLRSLLTYPYIQQRHASGDLKLFGWHYDIRSGAILNYDLESGEFHEISGDSSQKSSS